MKRRFMEEAPLVAGINVTPIIDVALVLVIILLITAPIITAIKMDINLPQAKTRSVEDEIRLSITLGKNGDLAVDDVKISQYDLIPMLNKRISEASKDDILVVVRADSEIPYIRIREVIKDAKSAGAKRIAIATRHRGKEKP
ncbi:MAG: hypothetical protein GTO29_08435 [Candidatus Latescibacteria bacterium]|nr:hypothetical protein [Candidatus Latescibacterota bacterium]NIO56190.1 hypothetical protein [Candidatus Latescibacterota bacterium]